MKNFKKCIVRPFEKLAENLLFVGKMALNLALMLSALLAIIFALLSVVVIHNFMLFEFDWYMTTSVVVLEVILVVQLLGTDWSSYEPCFYSEDEDE